MYIYIHIYIYNSAELRAKPELVLRRPHVVDAHIASLQWGKAAFVQLSLGFECRGLGFRV